MSRKELGIANSRVLAGFSVPFLSLAFPSAKRSAKSESPGISIVNVPSPGIAVLLVHAAFLHLVNISA